MKSGERKFAVTLLNKRAARAIRVAYRPTLQPKIHATSFMEKRAARGRCVLSVPRG